jgi:hypothetical protein
MNYLCVDAVLLQFGLEQNRGGMKKAALGTRFYHDG